MFSVALARYAGAEGAGQYYLGFSVVSVLYVLSKLGSDSALVREVAIARAENDYEDVSCWYATAWTAVGVASVVLAVVAFVGADYIGRWVFDDVEVSTAIRVMAVGLPAMSLTSVVGRSLVGLDRVLLGGFVEGGGLGILQLGVYLLGLRQFGVPGAAWSLAVGNLALLLMGVLAWQRLGLSATGRLRIGRFLRLSRPFLGTELLSVVSGVVGVVVLGALSNPSEAGVYAVANRVAKLGALALVPVTTALSVRFASAYHRRDQGQLRTTYQTSRRSLAVLSALATIAVALPAPFFATVLGEEFEGGFLVVVALAVGYGINVSQAPAVTVLQMTGRERNVERVMIVATAFQVIVSVPLVRSYAALGAALGASLAMAVRSVWLGLMAKSHLDRLPGNESMSL